MLYTYTRDVIPAVRCNRIYESRVVVGQTRRLALYLPQQLSVILLCARNIVNGFAFVTTPPPPLGRFAGDDSFFFFFCPTRLVFKRVKVYKLSA